MIYKELTPEAKAAYLANPDHCPYCGSECIATNDTWTQSNEAYASIRCVDCGLSWDETFTMSNVEASDVECESCQRTIELGEEIEPNDGGGVCHEECPEE